MDVVENNKFRRNILLLIFRMTTSLFRVEIYSNNYHYMYLNYYNYRKVKIQQIIQSIFEEQNFL